MTNKRILLPRLARWVLTALAEITLAAAPALALLRSAAARNGSREA